LPWRKKRLRGPHHNIPVLEGWLQREQRLSLHLEPHGEGTTGTGYTRRGFISIKERNWNILSQSPHGHGRVPFTGSFQGATGQGARQAHLGFLSHEKLDQMIFRGLFQHGWFYGLMNFLRAWVTTHQGTVGEKAVETPIPEDF